MNFIEFIQTVNSLNGLTQRDKKIIEFICKKSFERELVVETEKDVNIA